MGDSIIAWLSGPNGPAWVQAVGSVFAIFVAVYVPAHMRSRALADTEIQRRRERIEHLTRLTAALRAELDAAIMAAYRYERIMESGLKALSKAERQQQPVQSDRITSGFVVITDALVYREITAELGLFPAPLVQEMVLFYAFALEVGRMCEVGATFDVAYRALLPLMPRIRMHAAKVITLLDRYVASDFDDRMRFVLSIDELKAIAEKVGYDILPAAESTSAE